MERMEIHSCAELMEYIQQLGFLPLLDSRIFGSSAEDVVDEDCRYVVFWAQRGQELLRPLRVRLYSVHQDNQ